MKRFNIGALVLVYIGYGQPDLLGWVYATLCLLAVINRNIRLSEYLVVLDQPPGFDKKSCLFEVARSRYHRP